MRFDHEILDLMFKPYEEESLKPQMMPRSIESADYGLSVEGLDKAPIRGLIKVRSAAREASIIH